MGQTHIAPLKEDFFAESRHFFAVLLDVTQEKITQSQRKRPFEGAMLSCEDVAKALFCISPVGLVADVPDGTS